MVTIQCFLLALVVVAVSAKKSCQEEYDELVKQPRQTDEWMINILTMIGIAIPECKKDGTYKPLQCGPGSDCRCVDAKGDVLPGYDKIPRFEANKCQCARKKHHLTTIRKIKNTIGCNEVGNYEKIQCTGSECECVNPINGKPIGKSVPSSQLTTFKC